MILEPSQKMQPFHKASPRPSVSLVEQSRLKTRMAQINPPVSSHALEGPIKQSRAWHIIGYALLLLVIMAGAAGLYYLDPAPLTTHLFATSCRELYSIAKDKSVG